MVTQKYILFDLYKAFYHIESSHKSGFFLRNDLFSFMRVQHVQGYHLV